MEGEEEEETFGPSLCSFSETGAEGSRVVL